MTKTKLIEENKALKEQVTHLKHQLEIHRKALFGPKAEPFREEVADNQLSIFERTKQELSEKQNKEEEVEAQQTISYQRKKTNSKKKGRQVLPANIERVDIILNPDCDVTGWEKIGEEITEELDYMPPKFRVNRYIRPIYANPKAKTSEEVSPAIVTAYLPSRPIDKGIASAQLLAHLIVSKFVDHLPYDRQTKMFHRIDISISSSTINGWMARTFSLIEVLYNKFCEHHFKRHDYIQVDETTIRVLKFKNKKTGKQKKGKAHTGYFWVYYAPKSKNVVFRYDAGRGRQYPVEHLKDFSGKLQSDGYSVYTALDQLDRFVMYACLAHIRRKFIDAQNNDADRATKALKMIQQLYAIEDFAREKNYTATQRLELRQQKSKPITDQLNTWLTQQKDQVLPSSPIGKAITYALNRWKYQIRYLEDGQIEIDNNLVENAIRPAALGRKNYLFAGSEQGAKWAAMAYTIIRSAQAHNLNPQTYLADILRRLPDTPITQLDSLFPQNWEEDKTHPLYPPPLEPPTTDEVEDAQKCYSDK